MSSNIITILNNNVLGDSLLINSEIIGNGYLLKKLSLQQVSVLRIKPVLLSLQLNSLCTAHFFTQKFYFSVSMELLKIPKDSQFRITFTKGL